MRSDPTAPFFPSGDVIIDLGCGDGAWLDGVHHRYRRAIGFDSSTRRQQQLTNPINSWEFVQSDLNLEIPLPDASVDAARANQVIEHIENPITFMGEIHRVLRPGGVFVATTPNIRYVRHLASIAMTGTGPMTSSKRQRTAECWDGGHIHFFTPNDLRWLAREVGFSRVRTQAVIDDEGRLRWLRPLLAKNAGNRFVQSFLSGNTLLSAWK